MRKAVKRFIILCILLNLILVGLITFGGFSYIKEQKNTVVVAAAEVQKQPEGIKDSDFVNIKEFIPDLIYEPKYKTTNNITGKVLYSRDYCYLRYGTAVKLKKAQNEFIKMGIRIKIWDAYRPPSVQNKLWAKVSDTRFIANPARGSVHNRGAAVDMTLVDKDGHEIKMPSGFDEFDSKADRDFSDVDAESANNARVLEKVMVESGFDSVTTEWWHFNDKNWKSYSIVQDVSESSVKKSGYSLEVSGSEVKQADFEDEFKNFTAWVTGKIENAALDSVKTELSNHLRQIKGLFNNIVNT